MADDDETVDQQQPEDPHPHVAVWVGDEVWVGCLQPAPDADADDELGDVAAQAEQDPRQPVAASSADAAMTLGHGGPGDGSEPPDDGDEQANFTSQTLMDRLDQPPYRSFGAFAAGPIATARARDWRSRR